MENMAHHTHRDPTTSEGSSDAASPQKRPARPDPAEMVRILDCTLKRDARALQALKDQEQGVLYEVAQRHSGQAFCFAPVAVDLIDAMIRLQLGLPSQRSQGFTEIVRAIAATLWEDQHCRSRLNQLWIMLNENHRTPK
ncbi:MAG: hypothetical protein EA377_05345 [Phycisphaerales bacterium]|nr:MAG: hypothetical protein EA377_05345 [Phycisphaerales bacterium]